MNRRWPGHRSRESAARHRAALALTILPGALICCGPGEPRDEGANEVRQPETIAAEGEPAPTPADEIEPKPRSVEVERERPQPAPDTTGVATGPGGQELDPAQLPRGAYQACKDFAATQLADPQQAVWGKLPDTVERAPSGEYALVGQVRPDSVSSGLSFLCVISRAGKTWRVIKLEMR